MRLLIFHLTQTILEPLPGSADPQCIHFLQILTIAVLAIVLTAPLGAIAVSLLGPVLLTKIEEEEELQTNENHHVTNGLFCTVKGEVMFWYSVLYLGITFYIHV